MIDYGKRKLERYSLKIPARITVHNKTASEVDKKTFYLTTNNVCSGGAYFRTDSQLQLGTEVGIDMQLTINLGTKAQKKLSCVQVSGRVIRIEETGMAIQFNRKYKILPVGSDQ